MVHRMPGREEGMKIRGVEVPIPVVLLLSHEILLGAVNGDVAPHVGCTTLSVKISNMAAGLWTPCGADVTPVDLWRMKGLAAPGGGDSA